MRWLLGRQTAHLAPQIPQLAKTVIQTPGLVVAFNGNAFIGKPGACTTRGRVQNVLTFNAFNWVDEFLTPVNIIASDNQTKPQVVRLSELMDLDPGYKPGCSIVVTRQNPNDSDRTLQLQNVTTPMTLDEITTNLINREGISPLTSDGALVKDLFICSLRDVWNKQDQIIQLEEGIFINNPYLRSPRVVFSCTEHLP